MARACSICQHSERSQIEEAIANNESLRDIAPRFGVSKSALDRHREHSVPIEPGQPEEALEILHFSSSWDPAVLSEIPSGLDQIEEAIQKAAALRTKVHKLEADLDEELDFSYEDEDEDLDSRQLMKEARRKMLSGLNLIKKEEDLREARRAFEREILDSANSWFEEQSYEEEEW